MKKTAALLLALLAPPAAASDCAFMSSFAEAVMQSHQKGVPMTTTIANLDSIKDASARKGLVQIVVMAYEKPRYQTAGAQARAVAEFRDLFAVACFRRESGER